MSVLFDRNFKKQPGRYIVQCFIVVAVLVIILSFLDVIKETALIASLGATAFTVFTMPNLYTSSPRALFGGYAAGMGSGLFFWYLSSQRIILRFIPSEYVPILFAALAVGTAIFMMVIFNAEHAPSAGIALGLVLNDWSVSTLIFLLSAVVVMFAVKKLLKGYLIEL